MDKPSGSIEVIHNTHMAALDIVLLPMSRIIRLMSAEAATEKKIQEETTTKTEYTPEEIEAEKQRTAKKTTTTETTETEESK